MSARVLEKRFVRSWPPSRWRDRIVLAAVSGGPDSVALLRALCACQPDRQLLVAAHFNHRWRGQESDEDEAFVAQLCDQLEVRLRIARAPRTTGHDRPREAQARHDRYWFLKTTAQQDAARYVVTAHTADDQVETVLHHILRGTGLAGLAGIPRVRRLDPAVTLVRPFLTFCRRDTLTYLQALGQPYRVDPSNSDPTYLRNRIRHQLLPLLEHEYYPAVRRSLLQLAWLAGEARLTIQQQVDTLCETHVSRLASGQVVVSRLDTLSGYVGRELLRTVWASNGWPLGRMTGQRWISLANWAANSEAGAAQQILPGNVWARRDGDRLILWRPGPPEESGFRVKCPNQTE